MAKSLFVAGLVLCSVVLTSCEPVKFTDCGGFLELLISFIFTKIFSCLSVRQGSRLVYSSLKFPFSPFINVLSSRRFWNRARNLM